MELDGLVTLDGASLLKLLGKIILGNKIYIISFIVKRLEETDNGKISSR